MKASYRNQRQGCSAKHNDRTNITYDKEKEKDNELYVLHQGSIKQMRQNKNGTMEKCEILAYKTLFKDWLEKRNAKAKADRHPDRIKTMEQIYKSDRYKPDETVFQIGSAERGDAINDKKEFKKALNKYLKDFQNKYPQVKILSIAIHADEGALHAHIRTTFITKDKTPGMDKALEEMGIERPDTNKKNSKYNNRKITYTNECRELYYQSIENELGIEIDRNVESPSRKRTTKNEHEIELQEAQIKANKTMIETQNKLIQEFRANKLTIDSLNKQKALIGQIKQDIKQDISHWVANELETRLAIAEKTIELLGPQAKELHKQIDNLIRNEYDLEYDD